MPRIRMVIAMLAAGLFAGAARAGVYNLDDPPPMYPPLGAAYKDIRLVLDPLRVALLPLFPDQSPEGYKRHAAELESKPLAELTTPERVKLGVCYLHLGRPGDAVSVLRDADQREFLARTYLQLAKLEARRPGDLTITDKINLGACYIRLRRTNDAVRVLDEANQASPGNFLVLANLAAAYQLNEPERAVPYQEQALSAWPSVQPGWNQGELAWFRRVEGFQLKLLQLRQRESLANPAVKRWDTMDLLFDRPRLPAGAEYEPQIEPWKLWGDLPPDAYAVVGQLLLWSPDDDRLYWQLGELLNALGNVQDAVDVFNELVDPRSESTVRELMQHRRVLKDSLAVANAVNDQIRNDPAKFQLDYHTLMWAVSPRGLMLLPPGLGDAADETAMAARAEVYSTPPPAPAPAPRAQRGWWDWQPIFVGFAAGVIVATLGALQWMEWRRRRHGPAPTPPPGPPRPAAPTPPSKRTEAAVHDAGAFRIDPPGPSDRLEGAP